MEKFYLISLILCLFLSGLSCKNSQEAAKTEAGKKVEKASQAPAVEKDEESTLKIVAGSGNTVGVDLTNKVPVKGVQFTIEGVKVTEVRTTSRAEGFLAEFNEKNGRVILLSFSGNKIDQGTGPIAEIICDEGASARLSGIKIVK
jgi:hypothetical protein